MSVAKGRRWLKQEPSLPTPSPTAAILGFLDGSVQLLPTATAPPSPVQITETPAPSPAENVETPAPAENAETSAPAPREETPAPTATVTPAPNAEETPAPSFAETPAPSPAAEVTPAPSPETDPETPAPSPQMQETPAPVAAEDTPSPIPPKFTAEPTLRQTAGPKPTAAPTPVSIVRTSRASISGKILFAADTVTDTTRLRSAIATFFGSTPALVTTQEISSTETKPEENVRRGRRRRRLGGPAAVEATDGGTPLAAAGSCCRVAAGSYLMAAAGSGAAAAAAGASRRQQRRRQLADGGSRITFAFATGFAGYDALLHASAAMERLLLPEAWATLGSALGIDGGNLTLAELVVGTGNYGGSYSSATQDVFWTGPLGNGEAVTVDIGGGGYVYGFSESDGGSSGISTAERGGLVCVLLLLCFTTFFCVFWPLGELWLTRQRRSRAKIRSVLRALGWGPDGLPLPPPVKPGSMERARQKSNRHAVEELTPAASVRSGFLSHHPPGSMTAETSPREETSPAFSATANAAGKVGAGSAADLAAALAAAAAATAAVEAAEAAAAAESFASARRESLKRGAAAGHGRGDSFRGGAAHGNHGAIGRAAALKFPSIGSTSSFGDSVNLAWRYNSSSISAVEFMEPPSPAVAAGGAAVPAQAFTGVAAAATVAYISSQKNNSFSQQKRASPPAEDVDTINGLPAGPMLADSGVTGATLSAEAVSESGRRSGRWAFPNPAAWQNDHDSRQGNPTRSHNNLAVRQINLAVRQDNLASHTPAATAGMATDWKRRLTWGGGVEASDIPVQSRRPANYLVGAGAWRSEGHLVAAVQLASDYSENSDSDSGNDERKPENAVIPPAAAVAPLLPLRPLPHGGTGGWPASMAAAPAAATAPAMYRSSSAAQLGTPAARQKASLQGRGQADLADARVFATAAPGMAGDRVYVPKVERPSDGEQTLQCNSSLPMGGRFSAAGHQTAAATLLPPQQAGVPCGSFAHSNGSYLYQSTPALQQGAIQTMPRQEPIRQGEQLLLQRQLSPQEHLHQLEEAPSPSLQQLLRQSVTDAHWSWSSAAPGPRGPPSSVASVRRSGRFGTAPGRGNASMAGGGVVGSGVTVTSVAGGGVALGGIAGSGCSGSYGCDGGGNSSNGVGYAGELRFPTTGDGITGKGSGGVAGGGGAQTLGPVRLASSAGIDSRGGGIGCGGSLKVSSAASSGNVSKSGSNSGCNSGSNSGSGGVGGGGGHGGRGSIVGGSMAGSVGSSGVAGGTAGGSGHVRGSSTATSSSSGGVMMHSAVPLPISRGAAPVSPLPEIVSPMSDSVAEFNHGDMTIRFASGPPSVAADPNSPAISADASADSLSASPVQPPCRRAVSILDNGSEMSDAERVLAAQAWSPSPGGNSDFTSVGGLSRLSSVMGSALGSADSGGVWERPWMQERALDARQ